MKSVLCKSCGNLGSYRTCAYCYNASEYVYSSDTESKTIVEELKRNLDTIKTNSYHHVTNEHADDLCIKCKYYPTKAQPKSYMCIACRGHNYFEEKEKVKEVMKPSYQIYKPKEVKITNVIFNDPATIVFWSDGTKTVVKCNDSSFEDFDPEKGLAMAIAKKALGNKGNYYNEFKKWVGPYSLKVLEDAMNGMFAVPKCWMDGTEKIVGSKKDSE